MQNQHRVAVVYKRGLGSAFPHDTVLSIRNTEYDPTEEMFSLTSRRGIGVFTNALRRRSRNEDTALF
jgi:hypothetical protein